MCCVSGGYQGCVEVLAALDHEGPGCLGVVSELEDDGEAEVYFCGVVERVEDLD